MNPTRTKLARLHPPGSALKLISAAALLFSASAAVALGFGRPSSDAVLGELLDVAIPVRLDGGEDLQDNCLTAEVYFGDNKQMQGTIQVRVEGTGVAQRNQRTVRITSSRRVDEPFVTLYVAAGCTSSISRKFVLFADPPAVAPAVAAPALPTGGDGGQESTAAVGSEASGDSLPRAAAQAPARSPRRSVNSGTAAAAGSTGSAAEAVRRSPRAAASVPAPATVAAAPAAIDPSLRVTPPAPRRPVADEEGGRPRLMLDPAEADLMITPELRMAAGLEQAPNADAPVPDDLRARRAAAAAMWRALNASPEDIARDRLRLQELEARLAALRDGAAAASATGTGPGQQAANAPGWLVYALAGLSAALAAALAAVLLRRGGRRGSRWWQGEAPAAAPAAASSPDSASIAAGGDHPAEPAPSAAAKPGVPTVPSVRGADVPQAPAPVTPSQSPRAAWPYSRTPTAAAAPAAAGPAPAPAPAPAPTPASPAPVAAAASALDAPRAVSVEELIDLEQQAEFFLVLGQDQAAIDLLESHVAGPAGGSPLPYLKLLELYRRREDRQAYENLRERFNGRFNAYAPQWEADLQSGHSLSDYPGVIERLQALWAMPDRAMEVLQASLLRSDPKADTFDLPAYRELLFLYSVARDLAEREGAQPAVDLLLPFADEAPAAPVVQPLMATRPIKAQPTAQPPLVVDFTLDDIEPADAVPPNAPLTPPGGAPSALPPDTGPIDFEHIDVPKKAP